MFTNGQTINYDKYYAALENTPAPILASQLPKVHIDLAGLMKYAHDKGKRLESSLTKKKITLYQMMTLNPYKKRFPLQLNTKVLLSGTHP